MKIDRVKGITCEDEGFRWRAVSRCLNALLIMRIFAKVIWSTRSLAKEYDLKVQLTYFNLFALNGVEILCLHRNSRNILNSVTLGFLSSWRICYLQYSRCFTLLLYFFSTGSLAMSLFWIIVNICRKTLLNLVQDNIMWLVVVPNCGCSEL